MKNLWNDSEAAAFAGNALEMRVYTSRLLGRAADLVLHGGGNTSVKTKAQNIFGETEDIIYVKGSGWDLATIEAAGFAPVRLQPLQQLATLAALSDTEMVRQQRMAMTNPSAPTPSVEAILHAIIPYAFVDHTHADAVVTISNTPGGAEKIKALYGERMLIVPYIMPGFVLARKVYEMTQGINWGETDGIILLNHGVFTYDDDARKSYTKMIDIVSKAEAWLAAQHITPLPAAKATPPEPLRIARLRKAIATVWGKPILLQRDDADDTVAFSNLPDVQEIASRGPLTPDHIIRTKRVPMILQDDDAQALQTYVDAYTQYFAEQRSAAHIMLDAAPRWVIWPGQGTLLPGTGVKDTAIVRDISRHTMRAIWQAGQIGGWQALPEADLFEVEYWVLEQEKLKLGGNAKPMQGRIALVTGAAGGIGRACVEKLLQEGAVVAALDINDNITTMYNRKEVLGIRCDVSDAQQLQQAVTQTVLEFGGLDMLVLNAGIFPKSAAIAEMDDAVWAKSLDINLTSQQRLLQYCTPYLAEGFGPSVVMIASKNVPAPGPGAAAYSVAKAGMVQLGRVAALELGALGIRVNMVHPNAVYDTGIWTEDVLQSRAAHYGLTVAQYKANNVLQTEVRSADVAGLVVTMLGPAFGKTTGAQVAVDGGNERVI
jgi:rhamnose utilization protein RhaD (predicted bifunctional aldolase and dehydrogenase)/NAD(P)-dependent dehydrogenase (short-subunit alcohol dehydrogenase family)